MFLLNKIGYDTIDLNGAPRRDSEQMRSGHSGLEVRGRGTWHQIDAFAIWRHSPAFMYRSVSSGNQHAAHRLIYSAAPDLRERFQAIRDVPERFTGSPEIQARKESTADVAVDRSLPEAPQTLPVSAHFFQDAVKQGAALS
ncbi:MAG: hypothetical protein QJR04_20565 [Burkholderia multivorans]|uniref:hypothetical protein n=1 Tax=Burkholderia multivorans TaxID=87883 RepID=UPI0011B20DCC|nr:hypothetical protein [Burkholderia multivorans]MCA8412837.1 hypothetical protein [Burkholderia multivorans]MDI3303735.1 hypothetical protein [Burkholderia multivorans]